jgi:O-antigen/teichoic acid export membrane protein
MVRRRAAALPVESVVEASIDYRELARIALPIFAIGIAGYFQRQVAFWIVGARLGAGDIARFGAAMKLAGILSLPVAIVGAVVAPIIAEMRALGRNEQLERVVRLMSTLGSLPSLVAVIVIGLAGGKLLSVLFGPFYANAGSILLLLAVGQAFNVLTGLNDLTLIMTGHERWVLVATLIGLATVVLMSYATIGPLGALGPAIGVAAGYVTMNTFTWIAARLLLGVWTHAGIGPIVAELRELAHLRRR